MTKSGMRIIRRGEPAYEQARRAATWNARDYGRYPDVIVQATTEQDVVAAVRLAKAESLKIGVRSGGHSWSAHHVRDGGMLLDLDGLKDRSIDASAMTATAGPGCDGAVFGLALARQGLMFPTGHCRGVGLGGFILQGGFGWYSRELGLACESVIGIDYVDAEGVLRHASEKENSDIFWAVRGAGAGFFAVVTRFHLRIYKRPRFVGMSMASYPADKVEEVIRWAHAVGPEVPRSVELMVILSRKIPGVRGPGIMIIPAVYADSWRDARKAQSFIKSRPGGARIRTPVFPCKQIWMTGLVNSNYPDGHCYAADNMWSRSSADELVPGVKRILATLPQAPSHMLWFNWAPPASRPDMAYSLDGPTYIAVYGVWKDAPNGADSWPQECMKAMESVSCGTALGDENLNERPAPFLKPENMVRLGQLRAKYDPDGRFHPYIRVPDIT